MRIVSVLATGLLGFAFPRILLGIGVPLDDWAFSLGQLFGLVDADTALWIISGFTGFVFAGVEGWKRPLGRLWGHLSSQRVPASSALTPNWSARYALRYLILNSKWALSKNPNEGNILVDAEGTLRDQARLGRIHVWARPKVKMKGTFWETLRRVEEHEWDSLKFDLPSCFDDRWDSAHLIDFSQDMTDQYLDVQVNKEQVLSMWSEASWFSKWRDPQYKRRKRFLETERQG